MAHLLKGAFMKMKNNDISERLRELITAYIDRKNEKIKQINCDIDKENKELRKKYRNKLIKAYKPAEQEKIRKYTKYSFIIDFEKKTGVCLNINNLNKWLNGSICPKPETLYTFCKFFNVSCEYLIGYSDIKNPATAKISEILGLSESSTNALINCCKRPESVKILNALLEDNDNLDCQLYNIYSHSYQSYKIKNSSIYNNNYNYNNEMFHDLLLIKWVNRDIDSRLMFYFHTEFDNQLNDELNQKYYDNYDNYEETDLGNTQYDE